jgi:hypothetical protein
VRNLLRRLWYAVYWCPVRTLWVWLKWGDPVRYQQDLRTLIEFTGDLMRQHGLVYWLDYGVLLGAVRHERLILWDYDLDVGITSESFARFNTVMETLVLPPDFSYRYKADEWYSVIQYKDVVIDFVEYAFEEETKRFKPHLIPYYDDAVNWAEYCPPMDEHVVMPLRVGTLWDREYPIPNNADAYLRVVYGNYWKVDPIPLGFSYLYHPRQTAAFMADFRARTLRGVRF